MEQKLASLKPYEIQSKVKPKAKKVIAPSNKSSAANSVLNAMRSQQVTMLQRLERIQMRNSNQRLVQRDGRDDGHLVDILVDDKYLDKVDSIADLYRSSISLISFPPRRSLDMNADQYSSAMNGLQAARDDSSSTAWFWGIKDAEVRIQQSAARKPMFWGNQVEYIDNIAHTKSCSY